MTKKEKVLSIPVMMMQEITPTAFRNKLLKDRVPKEEPKFKLNDIVVIKDEGFVKRNGVIIGVKVTDYMKGWYYDILTIRLYDGMIEQIGQLEKNLTLYKGD